MTNVQYALPKEQVFRHFEKIVSAWLCGITDRHCTEDSLSAIRDAFLPKLLSGELRVADAEKFVEGV